MPKEIEITSWLSGTIFEVFRTEEIQVWLIGSMVDGSSKPRDCDILILVDPNCVSRLARVSPIWRQKFEERFNLPLHLTRLTYDEAKSFGSFLEAIFSRPNIRIHPQFVKSKYDPPSGFSRHHLRSVCG
jgi:hypothetical protein